MYITYPFWHLGKRFGASQFSKPSLNIAFCFWSDLKSNPTWRKNWQTCIKVQIIDLRDTGIHLLKIIHTNPALNNQQEKYTSLLYMKLLRERQECKLPLYNRYFLNMFQHEVNEYIPARNYLVCLSAPSFYFLLQSPGRCW